MLNLENLIFAAKKVGSKATTKEGAIKALKNAKVNQALGKFLPPNKELPPTLKKWMENKIKRTYPGRLKNFYAGLPRLVKIQVEDKPEEYIVGHSNTGSRYAKGNPAEWYPVGYYSITSIDHQYMLVDFWCQEGHFAVKCFKNFEAKKEGKGVRASLKALDIALKNSILGQSEPELKVRLIDGALGFEHPTLGHYHLSNFPRTKGSYYNAVEAAVVAYRIRREKQKEIELKNKKLSIVWVTVEDSLAAGNCIPVTKKMELLVQRKLKGKVAAVRADVLLSIRDDNYTYRAIRKAAERLGVSL